jgi:hypothetical protein
MPEPDEVTVPTELSDKLAEIMKLRRESTELIARLMEIRDRMTQLSLEASKPEKDTGEAG